MLSSLKSLHQRLAFLEASRGDPESPSAGTLLARRQRLLLSLATERTAAAPRARADRGAQLRVVEAELAEIDERISQVVSAIRSEERAKVRRTR